MSDIPLWAQVLIWASVLLTFVVDVDMLRLHRTDAGVSRCHRDVPAHVMWGLWAAVRVCIASSLAWWAILPLVAFEAVVEWHCASRHLPEGWFGRLRARLSARLPRMALGGAS